MLEMCGVADDSTRCVRMEDRAYLHTKRRRGLLSREELQREELQKRVCRLGLVEFNRRNYCIIPLQRLITTIFRRHFWT